MANFDFSTLNSTDLEELVCDLINAALPSDSTIQYRTYKEGKDKGIDFLYSTESHQMEHVGQVKHYYKTGFSGLLSVIKKLEVAKVRKLNPSKYIFATSVDLSVMQAILIMKTFNPYIKSLTDVYGKKDLNKLIDQNETVVKNHYKLWLCSTLVISNILNSDLQFRSSDFVEDELKKRIRIYVKTPLFDIARENLKSKNFLVLTGEPGVGKTMLAEMLVFEYINEGFDFHYIVNDIMEIERVLKHDDSKQIFYFDDFLGSNSLEINRAKGRETALVSIITRIKKRKNKKLIFTTRNIILNSFIQSSENFRRFSKTLNEEIFYLSEYSLGMKNILLRNHIEESEIDDNLKSVFEDKVLVKEIISHPNFNPRSIEFITQNENVKDFCTIDYVKFIRNNLSNPSEIWKHAYEQQIDDFDRWLLNTLLTFDGKVNHSLLEKAFNRRLECSLSSTAVIPINPFMRSLHRLDKGFIVRRNSDIDFINPSLKDFLINFVGNDQFELAKMLKSIKYINQFSEKFVSLLQVKEVKIPQELVADIISNPKGFLRPRYIDNDLIHLAIQVNDFVSDDSKNRILVSIIHDIKDWHSLHLNYNLNKMFTKFVKSTKDNKFVHRALTDRTESIVNDLFCGEYNLESAVELLEDLKETFDLDFYTFSTFKIERHLDELFSDKIATELDNFIDYIVDAYEVGDFREQIEDLEWKINFLGINYKVDMKEFNYDWEKICRTNDFRNKMQKDD